MTCGRSSRMIATNRPTASSSGALAKLSGRALVSVSGMPESWYPRRCSAEYPMASTLARSSAMRTSARLSRTSGVSAAGLRMSPASPPVQHASTQRMPSAVYLATVPAPFDASSSGCACTASRHNGLPAWSRGVAAMRKRRYRTALRSLTATARAPARVPRRARAPRPRPGRCRGCGGCGAAATRTPGRRRARRAARWTPARFRAGPAPPGGSPG